MRYLSYLLYLPGSFGQLFPHSHSTCDLASWCCSRSCAKWTMAWLQKNGTTTPCFMSEKPWCPVLHVMKYQKSIGISLWNLQMSWIFCSTPSPWERNPSKAIVSNSLHLTIPKVCPSQQPDVCLYSVHLWYIYVGPHQAAPHAHLFVATWPTGKDGHSLLPIKIRDLDDLMPKTTRKSIMEGDLEFWSQRPLLQTITDPKHLV